MRINSERVVSSPKSYAGRIAIVAALSAGCSEAHDTNNLSLPSDAAIADNPTSVTDGGAVSQDANLSNCRFAIEEVRNSGPNNYRIREVTNATTTQTYLSLYPNHDDCFPWIQAELARGKINDAGIQSFSEQVNIVFSNGSTDVTVRTTMTVESGSGRKLSLNTEMFNLAAPTIVEAGFTGRRNSTISFPNQPFRTIAHTFLYDLTPPRVTIVRAIQSGDGIDVTFTTSEPGIVSIQVNDAPESRQPIFTPVSTNGCNALRPDNNCEVGYCNLVAADGPDRCYAVNHGARVNGGERTIHITSPFPIGRLPVIVNFIDLGNNPATPVETTVNITI